MNISRLSSVAGRAVHAEGCYVPRRRRRCLLWRLSAAPYTLHRYSNWCLTVADMPVAFAFT